MKLHKMHVLHRPIRNAQPLHFNIASCRSLSTNQVGQCLANLKGQGHYPAASGLKHAQTSSKNMEQEMLNGNLFSRVQALCEGGG